MCSIPLLGLISRELTECCGRGAIKADANLVTLPGNIWSSRNVRPKVSILLNAVNQGPILEDLTHPLSLKDSFAHPPSSPSTPLHLRELDTHTTGHQLQPSHTSAGISTFSSSPSTCTATTPISLNPNLLYTRSPIGLANSVTALPCSFALAIPHSHSLVPTPRRWYFGWVARL